MYHFLHNRCDCGCNRTRRPHRLQGRRNVCPFCCCDHAHRLYWLLNRADYHLRRQSL